ncbi:unnamed protein product, partial [Prunus brigantina]
SIIGRGSSTGSRRGGVFSFGGPNSAIIFGTECTTGIDCEHFSLEEPSLWVSADVSD